MAFSETGKVWMNGKLVDWKDATIHVATHVVHYGSGVFEGIRSYDSKKGPNVFRLPEHMRRLVGLVPRLPDGPPYSLDQLNEAVLETIRANNFKSCYIRPLIYRGYAQLGVNPMPCPVEAAVIVWEWDSFPRGRCAGQRGGRGRQLMDTDCAEHVPGAWPRRPPTTPTPV